MRPVKFAISAALAIHLASFPLPSRAGENESPAINPLRSGLEAYTFAADTDDASSLFINPAGLAFRETGSLLLTAGYTRERLSELSAAWSARGFGIGLTKLDSGYLSSRSVRAGFAARLFRGFFAGAALSWHHSDAAENRSPFTADIGLLARPHRLISIGGVWRNSNTPLFNGERIEDDLAGGISIRPLTERVTLSAQGRFSDGLGPSWLFGGSFTIVPGLEVFGSYTRDLSSPGGDKYEEISAGLGLVLGGSESRAATRSRRDAPLDYSSNTLSILSTKAFRKDALLRRGTLAEITIGGKYLDEGGGPQMIGASRDLRAALADLESARTDGDIEGLLVKIERIPGAFIGPVSANLCEIRGAISSVRKAGKPVVAYIRDNAGAAELYVASAADRIVVPEIAATGFVGVSLEIRRMKRLFETMGVEWDYSATGDYKSSFHTQFTDTSTALQAEELQGLVDEAYRLLVDSIAEGRGMDRSRMAELSQGQVFTSREAADEGLIDIVGREDDAREELAKMSGRGRSGDAGTTTLGGRKYWTERWASPPLVAVVGAYGGIGTGESGRNLLTGGRTMGSRTLTSTLRRAASHPGVKALVLRVDSGGGSALASDEILGELQRIRAEEKIPVVISMSNAAASGGYWISMYGDAIFADPFTVTGSIGVVMLKPVMALLYERAGVTSETYKAGKYSDALSTGRHFTDEEMGILDGHIDGMYDIFVAHVAAGRNMDLDKAYSLAGGRIYFGTQALEAGLVDRLGGLSDAVEYAASLAGIGEDHDSVYFPAFQTSFIEKLLFRVIGLR